MIPSLNPVKNFQLKGTFQGCTTGFTILTDGLSVGDDCLDVAALPLLLCRDSGVGLGTCGCHSGQAGIDVHLQ